MNQKLKNKNRKAILLLLLGQILSTSFIWTRPVGARSIPDFLRGFAIGMGVVLMMAAVFMMVRNKRRYRQEQG